MICQPMHRGDDRSSSAGVEGNPRWPRNSRPKWLSTATAAPAETILGRLPWVPNAGNPPVPVKAGPWQFFSAEEGRALEAIADRIIPPDPQTPGGKDSGCAVF